MALGCAQLRVVLIAARALVVHLLFHRYRKILEVVGFVACSHTCCASPRLRVAAGR